MHKIFYNRKAQNFLEYVLLVSVISAAIIGMSLYIRRSINARLRQTQIELDESRR